MDWCGLFMTNDHLAMRVWDLRGQLKCVHHSKDENEYKLIKLCPIPVVQKVMGIYTKKGTESSAKFSKEKLFSEMLTVVQEVLHYTFFVSFNANCLVLCILFVD